MGIILSNLSILAIDPTAFYLGSWPIRWYGIIIGLGIVLAYLLLMFLAKKVGLNQDKLSDLIFWTILFGFVGARIYYVVFEWPYYVANPSKIFAIWEGGIAIYGGVIGGTLTIVHLCRRYQLPLFQVLDVSAPALMLGQTIGRWGNFINQEAYGDQVSQAFLQGLRLPSWVIQQMNIQGTYYHPTFLYESLWNLLGLLIILALAKFYKGLRNGDLAFSYLIWYGFGRFWIEGMRLDSLYLGPIRISQFVSICLFLIGCIGLYYGHQKAKMPPYHDLEVTIK